MNDAYPRYKESAAWHQNGLMLIMVFINRSKLLAAFAPAFCVALLVFPTKSSAQLPWKSPHGLFQLGGDAWTNPVVAGLRLQIRWTDIQPDSETLFDWSTIDKQVANAQTYNKQLGISLVILSAPPSWLTALPGVKTYLLPPKNGQTMPIVLPWDPIVQPKIINFITQLCLRYDGLADYIVMGGLGFNTESYMPDPADIGLDLTLSEAVTAWTGSSNTIIDAYGANLHSTPFIIAAGVPFTGTDAPTALTNVVSRAVTMYGPGFGIMQWGLNANSNTGYMPNALIAQYSPTNPAGFQFLCPVAGNDNGKVLGGTLEQTLDAGIALGAQWIEIYGEDADNPDYAAAFASASAALMAPTAPPQQSLLNVSTRTEVLGGDSVLIGGFIVTGDIPKSVVLRAIGPSLADVGVTGVLADPSLELYDSTGALMEQNDNWVSPLPANVVAGGLTPKDPAESLITATLPPGSYTAILRGVGGSSGVALFELYDLDPARSRISNLSTRGQAASGDQAMIGGFIIGGTQPTEILIRALGPSLSALGVSGALLDPVLELRGSDGSLIAENDNWRDNQEQQIIATTIPPSNDKESAIIATLAPGNYTALVRGAGTSSGIALVEMYSLTSN